MPDPPPAKAIQDKRSILAIGIRTAGRGNTRPALFTQDLKNESRLSPEIPDAYVQQAPGLALYRGFKEFF